jgi:hypothetical protein
VFFLEATARYEGIFNDFCGELSMKLNNHLAVFCFVATSLGYQVSTYASDMFGNPTVIGPQGKLELQIGGGKSKELALDVSKSVTTVQIGSSTSISQAESAASGNLEEDQVFVTGAYAVNAQMQIFANVGSGKGGGQKSTSRGIGFKLVPESASSAVKMGLILRAQQITADFEGPFNYWMPIFDSVNNYYLNAPVNGTEQLKFTRLDAFFGASTSTGLFRPYMGVALSRISGSDTLALDDTVSVNAWPISGGSQTTSTQHVVIHNKADLSASRYFTGVFGFSINPDEQLGMTAEFQIGVQKSITLAGNIRF